MSSPNDQPDNPQAQFRDDRQETPKEPQHKSDNPQAYHLDERH